MRTANRNCRYIAMTITYIRAIRDAAEIRADAVNRYANELKDADCSSRTVQAHLTAIKGSARWLARNNKLPHDPLASVTKPNSKTDCRRERRVLLLDEWPWLRDVTHFGAERFEMSGSERAVVYATAIQTGLRSSELRSVTPGRLFLYYDPPFITCKAGSPKKA